jgi:hypothetical protein
MKGKRTMKHITYQTEKRINQLKQKPRWERTNEEDLAIWIWDEIFSRNGHYGCNLKTLEQWLGSRIDSTLQINVPYYTGIHGLVYKTGGNVRYIGTHDLSYVNINDYNAWIRAIADAQ